MASADEVRRFVTEQFRRELLQSPFERYTNRSINEILIEIGERIEDLGWLTVGTRLGYFDEIDMPFDERDRALVTRVITSYEAVSWPRSFRYLARTFPSRAMSSEVELSWQYPDKRSEQDSADGRALFQAVMITAEGFRDPLVRSLQSSLVSQYSILDRSSESIDPEQVLRALEEFGSEPTRESAVAGLIGLMEVIAALDEIFTSDAFGWPRRALIHDLSLLLYWHLNLEDQRLVRRLEVVSRAFWEVCESEFSKQSDLRWSSQLSRRHWQRLLLNWRDRLKSESFEALPTTDFLW
jgi:hypothetical protein